LKYIGFDGQGFQVRDCLHPSDLAALVAKQLQAGLDPSKLSVINVSGRRASARSLQQLSSWCEDFWGPLNVATELKPRSFGLPWVVLDCSLASDTWSCHPARSTESIMCDIAELASSEPDWIQFSA
jgi:CDP-paratose 2-epimerase